jgi:hypothetical protein
VDDLLTDVTGSWPFWAAAVALAGAGTLLATATAARSVRATESADGTVVGIEESTDGDGVILYAAVVAFTAAGADRRVVDPVATRPAAHRLGDRVRVSFPPGRPDLAQFRRWRYAWPLEGIAGAGWTRLAVGLYWQAR